MEKRIELRTMDGGLVIELDFDRDLAIYMMTRNGKPPEAVIWGTRFFIRSADDARVYAEGFAAYCLTGINEVPDGH